MAAGHFGLSTVQEVAEWCCSSATTGPKTTTMWRCRTSTGRALRRGRLPEGMDGMTRFHELVGRFVPDDADPSEVLVCIETDRGPWVRALIAAGYQVFGVNPKQAARHREILSSSGAKSDKADAHALADMVRTRRHQLRQVAADSDIAEAVKVVARAHQTLIWERTRHMLRLRAALRDYFPAALEAYAVFELTGRAVLALLAKAPTPAAAAKLTLRQIAGRSRRLAATSPPKPPRSNRPCAPSTWASPTVAAAYAATVRSPVAVLHAERRDREPGEGGRGPFWPAPGR